MPRHRKLGRIWHKDTASELANVATPEEARIAQCKAYCGTLAGTLPPDYYATLEELTRGKTARETGEIAQRISKTIFKDYRRVPNE